MYHHNSAQVTESLPYDPLVHGIEISFFYERKSISITCIRQINQYLLVIKGEYLF